MFEESLFADFSFAKAQKADHYGNLVFNKSARNFNQDMTKAAKYVVEEVEKVVEDGEIDPDQVQCASVCSQNFQVRSKLQHTEKKIEKIEILRKGLR